MKQTLHDAMLFSVERGAYPYKYRLYFAEPSVNGEMPEIHRMYVRSRRAFSRLKLGGIYDVDYRGIRVIDTKTIGTHDMTDDEYFDLLYVRDRMFQDKNNKKRLGMYDKDYDPEQIYYTFDVFKSLVEYKPGFWQAFTANALKLFCYFLSFLVPIALYLLLVYLFSSSGFITTLSSRGAVTVPITAICIIPFIIWIMSILHTAIMTLLLNVPYIMPYMLKIYALRLAGIRKSCVIEDDTRKSLFISGAITLTIAVISVIIMFVI